VNLFGHANTSINQALKDQLDTLEHAMLAGFTHPPVVELSERLGALTNHQLGHAFFASDGASAIEIALKMSFHYWQNIGQPNKKEFICLKNSYHGETLGALAVTDVAIFKDAYGPLIGQAHIVESPASPSQEKEAMTLHVQNALLALEETLKNTLKILLHSLLSLWFSAQQVWLCMTPAIYLAQENFATNTRFI